MKNKFIIYVITIFVLVSTIMPVVALASTDEVSAATVSTKSYKTKQKKVIKKAKTRLGCKYVWAAEGPKKFDCSGYVYWVYKHAGVKVKKKVPRSSCQGLYKSLKKYKVSSKISKAKAGDIILYKRGNRFGHAAISLGNGKIIHASSSRRKVCIAKAKHVNHTGVAIIRVI